MLDQKIDFFGVLNGKGTLISQFGKVTAKTVLHTEIKSNEISQNHYCYNHHHHHHHCRHIFPVFVTIVKCAPIAHPSVYLPCEYILGRYKTKNLRTLSVNDILHS